MGNGISLVSPNGLSVFEGSFFFDTDGADDRTTSMIEVLVPCVLLCLLASGLRRLANFGASRPHKALAIHRLTQPHLDEGDGWHFEQSGLNLSIWTLSFNALPGLLLGNNNNPRRSGGTAGYRSLALLKRVYDAGSAIAAAGMCVSVGGAVWALCTVWTTVWTEVELHARQKGTSQIIKRAMETTAAAAKPATVASAGPSALQPLVSSACNAW